MEPSRARRAVAAIGRDVVTPLALYLAGFVALTWPRILDFGSRFFADEGDGLANAWNLWWVDRALTAGGPLLWTDHVHFPHGTTLAGHTLALADAVLAIPLRRVVGPVVAFDTLVVLSFVLSGLAAYWLALDATKRCGPSLVAGALFAFSSYLFAHAEGHLNLIALEGLPLFVLAFAKLLDAPSAGRAALAAAAFGLVALCELSYALHAAVAAALVLAARARDVRWDRRVAIPGALFVVLALVAAAPIAWPLWRLAREERLVGVHTSADYSLDLASLVVPGGHWRFASLTEPFWSRLAANEHETSVHLGLGVLALVAIGWRAPREWRFLFLGALVLALGPRLHILGWEVPLVRLPYRLLEGASSTLRISGMPIRLVAVATLAAAVLAAYGLARLWDAGRRGRALAVALLALALVEHLPRALPSTSPDVPPWVVALRSLPDGAVVDDVSRGGRLLYHQTIHGKKLAFGHLARIPRSVEEKDEPLRRALEAGDGAALARAGFRFVVVAPGRAFAGRVAFEDREARIVALGE
jgi:hypothetical protein